MAAHPYPGIRGGGLFLVIVGTGIAIGGLLGERQMMPLFGVAFLAGFLTLGLLGPRLRRPLGSHSRWQVWSIPAAIVVELLLLTLVSHALAHDTAPDHVRRLLLWILMSVGVHFVIFAIAAGPLMLWLAALCVLNATLGLWLPAVPLAIFWIADGLLKIVVGSLMFRTRIPPDPS